MEIQLVLREKERIRQELLFKLKNQSSQDRIMKSGAIEEKLVNLAEFASSTVLMCYAATQHEVATQVFMQKAINLGKTVCLPWIDRNQKEIVPVKVSNLEKGLQKGSYGIMEPVDSVRARLAEESLELVIVPGVVFDRSRNRIGRGEGYYDRFLGRLPSRVRKVALAFDFQIFEHLPVTNHDVPMDVIISESSII